MKRATFKGIVIGFAALLAATLTVPTQGWGRDGHQIAGAIAWHYLTDKAKASVTALLGNDDLPGDDPDGLFQNQFFRTYGDQESSIPD